ncbi:Uma2 family endonuclease [Cellulosilyticum sp. WCF-2]|uniref:Uma2 family endonuclease n=1 Tax=Cellulosilyticum sp. WCF-2 TaxID=2497860 RepID=UPI000F8E6E1B|nr:Uma2 family endonuclease [Cellulosilyticum sp. WCF-2]QEH67635.1 Uma2 family endonuclease [Cellulosilyticum sp. WCF-2]
MALNDDYHKEECIQGVIYTMSPSAPFEHATVNGNIYGELYAQLKHSLCSVFMENADLHFDEQSKDYVVPDIMIVCDTKAFKKGTKKYYGIPKFIVETLSPSTVKKDRTVKKDLYAKKGVSEYWIVDYKSKSVEVHYLKNGTYELVNVLMLQDDSEEDDYNAKEVLELREFPGVKLVLEDIFHHVDWV